MPPAHHLARPQIHVHRIVLVAPADDNLRVVEIVRPVLAGEFSKGAFGRGVALVGVRGDDDNLARGLDEVADDVVQELFGGHLVERQRRVVVSVVGRGRRVDRGRGLDCCSGSGSRRMPILHRRQLASYSRGAGGEGTYFAFSASLRRGRGQGLGGGGAGSCSGVEDLVHAAACAVVAVGRARAHRLGHCVRFSSSQSGPACTNRVRRQSRDSVDPRTLKGHAELLLQRLDWACGHGEWREEGQGRAACVLLAVSCVMGGGPLVRGCGLFALMNTQPPTKVSVRALPRIFAHTKSERVQKKSAPSQQTTTATVRFAMIVRTPTSHNVNYEHDCEGTILGKFGRGGGLGSLGWIMGRIGSRLVC